MAKYYQLKISLDETEPEIWRRVVVPADITLDRLHDVIQICMGWNDSHLHRFTIDGREYTDYFDEVDEGREEFEAMYVLGDLVKTKGAEFNYLYDYGDDWSHTVRYEKSRREPNHGYAITCEGGAMCCPPDDVGGIPGFEEFRRIMADPADEEYQDYLTWYGKPFDPKEFDRYAAQRNLAWYLRWSRPRPILRDYS
jgi:hypothetical protein